ncbi:MAG: 5-oxoprolinase subunit PxpB [Rhodocyclaceae bacterium]|nr:5-oxoprolinase subunit PxpB [Rhodocyclaceae bacterium]
MTDDVRLLPCGDAALTIELGASIDARLLARVDALAGALREAGCHNRLPGIIDVVQTFRSVTVRYDPLALSFDEITGAIDGLLDEQPTGTRRSGRRWRLPVCYGGEFGPDLSAVADATGYQPAQVCKAHSSGRYVVAMLGFLPGFAFMDGVARPLHLPRRQEPRLRVPPGSVAIAGQLTAIYPWESPGGWHLLGRCPLPLFDPGRTPPALLAPGDQVGFEAITPADFEALSRRCRAVGVDPGEWVDEPLPGAT